MLSQLRLNQIETVFRQRIDAAKAKGFIIADHVLGVVAEPHIGSPWKWTFEVGYSGSFNGICAVGAYVLGHECFLSQDAYMYTAIDLGVDEHFIIALVDGFDQGRVFNGSQIVSAEFEPVFKMGNRLWWYAHGDVRPMPYAVEYPLVLVPGQESCYVTDWPQAKAGVVVKTNVERPHSYQTADSAVPAGVSAGD